MRKIALRTVPILFALILVSGCAKPEFNGNRTSNATQFKMDYSVLSRAETHQMNLEAGDTVNIEIENTSGRLDVLVTGVDGRVIYRGDDADTGQFSISIPETGTYTFSVTGDRAKGRVSFVVAES